jgi:hypothetical protein
MGYLLPTQGYGSFETPYFHLSLLASGGIEKEAIRIVG